MFWHFSQNNSGGSFDFNKEAGITHHVVIEADTSDKADQKASEVGLYFDGYGDCPCCGNRWSEAWGTGDEVPSVYGKELGKDYIESWGNWMPVGYESVVHFKDGTKKWYFADGSLNENP